jgi:hypothetical protein
LEGDSETYKEVAAVGRMTDYDGMVTYPVGIPEDQYIMVIRNKNEKEVARYTETITSSKINRLKYTIEETKSIPSYPILSIASGITYWIISRRRREACQA